MIGAANWVLGWVELEVTGEVPEEFFNLCARENAGFWGARQLDPCRWVLRCPLWDLGRFGRLGARSGCRVEVKRRGGAPGLIWRLRQRWGLLAGMALALLAAMVLSQFVFTVRVYGNQRVSTGAILTQLRRSGVRPGAFGPALDVRQVSHEVILALPELSWMSVNLHGTVAEVLVREGRPRPEIVEEDEPAHIVARHTGIITHMDTVRGMALVKEGDTVVAGDTLIASWVDFVEPPNYQGDMGGMLVRAIGRVEARVWHTLRAAIPLEGEEKVYTGAETTRWSLEFFGHRVNFYGKGGIPYPKYDKITAYHSAALPGGRVVPVALRAETLRAYGTECRTVDREAAETVLRYRLQQRLDALVGQGEVLRADYAVEERDGLLTVTLLAECRQDIGLTVED